MKLAGVGPGGAQKIIDYRDAHGPFKKAQDLEKVDGVGKGVIEKNAGRIVGEVKNTFRAESASCTMTPKSVGAHTGSFERLLSGNFAGSNVTEPPAGSRRPERGERVLGPRWAAPRKGGDPADVYPYGDL